MTTAETPPEDVFLREILEQPASLIEAAAGLEQQQDELRGLHELGRSSTLVLTGMGSSYDACLSAASLLARDGRMATTVNTAELLHFRLAALNPSTTVIAVSQSGNSAELVRLAQVVAEQRERPRLVTVTNGLANPLAELADIALDTNAGTEEGPSTKTFAASLVVLRAAVEALASLDIAAITARAAVEVGVAAGAANRLLADPVGQAHSLAAWCRDRKSIVILGRGAARAAAEMGALTLKEVAKRHAESLDTAEFRHGPLELSGPDLAVVLISTESQTLELDRRLATELAHDGVATLEVTGDGEPDANRIAIGDLHPMLAVAVSVLPLQLLAWQLAVDSGRAPGHFTRASKVTTVE
jgi:glucosamine--fructose-6-phosphate aminotransferase (isomerizing)